MTLFLLLLELFTIGLCVYLLLKNKAISQENSVYIKNLHQQQFDEFIHQTRHLNNVIGGINHEMQPWIGSLQHKLRVLEKKISALPVHEKQPLLEKIHDCHKATQTMNELLNNLSKDIKSLQEYNLVCSNLGHSVVSWVYIALNDLQIKNFLKHENLYVDEESLNFPCLHSPMLLSQVILNLVKNSIEHNPDKEDLYITIFGSKKHCCLFYCDNGKGIPPALLNKIFQPGFSTKKNQNNVVCGLGLSLCKEYCENMKATIKALESNSGAKFMIKFSECCSNENQRDTTKLSTSIIKKIKSLQFSSRNES